jgi:hypothetical protein
MNFIPSKTLKFVKNVIAILFILILNSCYSISENRIKVAIKNNSNEPITNLEFTTTENLDVIRIDRIEPKDQVKEFLSMEKNELDGGYTLTFTRTNGEEQFISTGYYTNGGPIYRSVIFTVETDTTLVVFNDFY